MAELLIEQLQTVNVQFDTLASQTETEIEKLQESLEKIIKATSFLEDNWLGEWATPSYNFYFIPSTSQQIHLNEDEIWKYANSETGIDIEDIKNAIPPLTKKFREQKENTITELSIIKSLQGFEKEMELLDSIENFKWGISQSEYIESRKPRQVAIYDYSVLNKGMKTPPHIAIGGELISLFSILTSLKQFKDIQKRLVKQIELKIKLSGQPPEEAENRVSTFVIPMFEKFHQIATQLRNRHANRETITITDEYDVQDLLHGLLKIYFDDVRPEDAVPSYAGKNTRVDFLLKREKTIIEVKKTRVGLKDKEVGDQLILDVAHYKSHQDCKRLICFVYDPENLISNPRGLEDDLNRLTNEEMIVEVYIRP